MVLGDEETLHTFQIENRGTSDLNILSITVPRGFQLMKAPATGVPPGSVTDFSILMESESVGLKSGLVILNNNDFLRDPYTFVIEGRVLEPDGDPFQIFANRRSVQIRDDSIGDPYPSRIHVTGLEGLVAGLSVTLHELSHGFADDLDILLVGPGETRGIVLMSDAGGKNSLDAVNLEFRDDAPTLLPDELKIESGVAANLIEKHGAVSSQVAEAMAEAVRQKLGADVGVGITGVAGPEELEGNPPGTVYIGVAHSGGHESSAHRFPANDRGLVKRRAVTTALLLLHKTMDAA